MWTKRQLACEYRGVRTLPFPWFVAHELHKEGATEGLLQAKGRPARGTLAIWGPYRGRCGSWTWTCKGWLPLSADGFGLSAPSGVSRRFEQPAQGTAVSLHDAAKDGEPGTGSCRAQELIPLGRRIWYCPSHLPRSASVLLHPALHLRMCHSDFSRAGPTPPQRNSRLLMQPRTEVADPWKRQARTLS